MRGLLVVIACTKGKDQLFRNDVKGRFTKNRELAIAALHVVEEANLERLHSGVKGVDCWVGTPRINEARRLLQIRPVGVVLEFVDIIEHPTCGAQPLASRRRDTKFVGITLVLVADPIGFTGCVAGLADVSVIGRRVVNTAIAFVIRQKQADVRIRGIVSRLHGIPVQVRACVNEIEEAKAALDRQRRQIDVVAQRVRSELCDLQIADARFIVEHTIGFQPLAQVHKVDRPVIAKLEGRPDTATDVRGIVVIVLNEAVIVDRLASRRPIRAAGAVDDAGARFQRAFNEQRVAFGQSAWLTNMSVERYLVSAGDVIDIAALLIVIDHHAHRELVFDDRDVDIGLTRDAILAALGQRVGAGEPGVEFLQIGLVRDVAHRAAHRACAEQGALRPGENFDALEIGGVHIKIAARRGRGSIVEIQRDVRCRTGRTDNLKARGVGRKAANIDGRRARPLRGSLNVGQEFNQLVEVGDVEVGERVTRQRLNRDRNRVQIFLAPGRGHNDVGDPAVIGFRGRVGFLRQRRRTAGTHHGHSDQRGRQFPARFHVSTPH